MSYTDAQPFDDFILDLEDDLTTRHYSQKIVTSTPKKKRGRPVGSTLSKSGTTPKNKNIKRNAKPPSTPKKAKVSQLFSHFASFFLFILCKYILY